MRQLIYHRHHRMASLVGVALVGLVLAVIVLASLIAPPQARAGFMVLPGGDKKQAEPRGLTRTDKQKRVALIIGNSAYDHLIRLGTPRNDAKALAALLGENGFSVTSVYDADRNTMLGALNDFRIEAMGADVALVFYAGHGLRLAGTDILAPRDYPQHCGQVALKGAISVAQLTQTLAGARQRIMLLDACRGSLFPSCKTRFRSTGNNRRGTGFALRGLLIASSVAPGQNALDALLKRWRAAPGSVCR